MNDIATDYGWSMGFVVQIAIIIAIVGSVKLPDHMVHDAQEEVGYFKEHLEKYYKQ